jgi:hypothetical protein
MLAAAAWGQMPNLCGSEGGNWENARTDAGKKAAAHVHIGINDLNSHIILFMELA